MGSGGSGGVFGGTSQFLFGDGGAGAAQDAAMAQQSQAQRNFNYNKEQVDLATVAGLASFEKDIKNQEKNLARQEQLVSQIDPTIIEASQQALRLLRGEQSSTLAPLQNQRATQRQKLLNMLREQLGPGAETSTAGIQALTKFDAESANIFAGAQQQAISNLGQTAGQFNATRPDMFREIMGLSGLGQGGSQLRLAGVNALQGAQNGLLQTAGAENTAAIARGKQNAAFGQSLMSGAVAAGTGYALGDPTKATRIGSWLSGDSK